MATRICTAATRGGTGIRQVNVRSGPGTTFSIMGQLPIGLSGMRVLDVQPDAQNTRFQGRLYQWFKLRLPNNQEGWVRDDLLEISGNCSAYGYGVVGAITPANRIPRVMPAPPVTPPPVTPPAPPPVTPPPVTPPPVSDEAERIRKAAYNITAAFEGGSYASYNNTDAGVVSYGRFQATLASGNLEVLLDLYLNSAPTGTNADTLRTQYMMRVRAKDPSLRNDAAFRALLISLAADPLMQAAQIKFATLQFWTPMVNYSVLPRGIVTPLGLAFVFDTSIHHGLYGAETSFLRTAESALGVAAVSKLGVNVGGITEAQLITRAAEIRRDKLAALTASTGLGGLRVRGDFWVALINSADWQLQGDANGEILVKAGTKVQVRMP
ncbi:MAG: SH3 domain-containing protein [Anaerolineae bacterium]